MTFLQQCAFDRIKKLNSETYKILSSNVFNGMKGFDISYDEQTMSDILDKLSEQADLIHALQMEDEKDYEIDSGSGERTPTL